MTDFKNQSYFNSDYALAFEKLKFVMCVFLLMHNPALRRINPNAKVVNCQNKHLTVIEKKEQKLIKWSPLNIELIAPAILL